VPADGALEPPPPQLASAMEKTRAKIVLAAFAATNRKFIITLPTSIREACR